MTDYADEFFPREGGPIPLFPLPNLFLIPGALLPLHVFEGRYRELVDDLLDSSGLIMLGTVIQGSEDDPSDEYEVESVGGLGYLENYQVLPDGRYVILARGLARAEFVEHESDKSYREVLYEVVPDVPATAEEEARLEEELREALTLRTGAELELPDGLAVGQLADLLLMHLRLPPRIMCEVYQIAEASGRARRALDAHEEQAEED